MNAFHSFWSRPNINKNHGKVRFTDYELLTMMLSALKWKELNGQIKMITDSQGAEFFLLNGLDNLWDKIDTNMDNFGNDIDPFLFWAAGKLYALKNMSNPCVMLDTDLIIWKNINDFFDCDVLATHSEELMSDVYPNISNSHMKKSYKLPKEWNFNLKAANTSFLFIKEKAFKDYYVESANSFMLSIINDEFNPTTAMCFAEQRILPMCAEAKGLQVKYLLELKNAQYQDFITHLWGYKQILNDSYKQKKEFCIKCVRRIISDYPEYESILANNKQLSKYYKEYQARKIHH